MGSIPNCTVSDSQLSFKNLWSFKEERNPHQIPRPNTRVSMSSGPFLLPSTNTVTPLTFLSISPLSTHYAKLQPGNPHSHLRKHNEASAGLFQLPFLLLSQTDLVTIPKPSSLLSPWSGHAHSTSAQPKSPNPGEGHPKMKTPFQFKLLST